MSLPYFSPPVLTFEPSVSGVPSLTNSHMSDISQSNASHILTNVLVVTLLELLGKDTNDGNINVPDELLKSKDKMYFLGFIGTASSEYTSVSVNKVGSATWVSNDRVTSKEFDTFIERADEFFGMQHNVTSYDNISDESYVWYGYSSKHWAVGWFEDRKIHMRWFINNGLTTPTASPTPIPRKTAAPKKTSEPIDFSIDSVKGTIKRENYGYVSYADLARKPNEYKGKSLTYEGKIVQTIEDYSISGIVYYNIRLAIDGDYDSIVHITYMTGDDDPRLLEDDYVQVYGTADGLYTYESTSGKSVTLPEITATLIE